MDSEYQISQKFTPFKWFDFSIKEELQRSESYVFVFLYFYSQSHI